MSKGWRRALYAVLALVLFVLALPYLVTPFYLFVQPVSMPMLYRHLTGQPVRQTWLPLSEIAPVLPRTVIASEDSRFCQHRGVDWRSLRQLLREAEDFDDLRGGSTITQQTVKNLFLWSGRSYLRKALELPLALWVDLILGKRRVMEIYLNIATWGPGAEFGVEAGAQRAFRKSARDLDARQAALMAAILPNPHRRRAARPGPGLQRLAGIYMARANTPGLDSCLRRTERRLAGAGFPPTFRWRGEGGSSISRRNPLFPSLSGFRQAG